MCVCVCVSVCGTRPRSRTRARARAGNTGNTNMAHCILDDSYLPAPPSPAPAAAPGGGGGGWASVGAHLWIELTSTVASWNLTVTPFFTKRERDYSLQPADAQRSSLNTYDSSDQRMMRAF
jgi:hypothetical protein